MPMQCDTRGKSDIQDELKYKKEFEKAFKNIFDVGTEIEIGLQWRLVIENYANRYST